VHTLVISDLHLGNRSHRDVLRLHDARERLVAALSDVERLVLLGDTVELVHRQPWRSLMMAEPVLRALGSDLGPDREVVLVPGNHDGPLVRRWALAQGAGLQASAAVPAAASPALERVLSWLAPARARVSYPGVWLSDRVWATHGHYLDHHLVPDSPIGVLRPARRDVSAARPIDYEKLHQRSRRSRESLGARMAARPVATVVTGVADLVRVVPRLMLKTGMAPLTARLVDVQMRRATLPALARVAQHLEIDADWVLFGHVHRRGPIADEPWAMVGGRRLVNTGAWTYEPVLVDRVTAPHPYWPGGAVRLADGGPPRSLGLLDDLSAAQLQVALRTAPR
jgi:UDP-2,3-diacylglucosamine pyrophosphatase LpxH